MRPPQSAGVTSPALAPAAEDVTLLDEVGRLARPVTPDQVRRWRLELDRPVPAGRAASCALWLGEYRLAADEQPRLAIELLRRAQALSEPSSAVHGLAAYDMAMARFDRGEYAGAAAAFDHLLISRMLRGFDRLHCALWYRHAGACAGYHAQRAAMGIPEPPSLDPFCGAAGLASALRAHGLPFDRKTVLAACRVGGEGSNLADLVAACPKLGLVARPITADEAGLLALPKPVVAYVEHDHFISVIRADKRGVAYLCSDCGPWPGGRVDLTWKQWRALEPGIYLAAYRPGSLADRALAAALRKDRAAAGVRLAARDPRVLQRAQDALGLARLVGLLEGHVLAYLATTPPYCGGKPQSLHCPPWISCPTDNNGAGDCFGPCSGDPVNLATGEEEYRPATDLFVYNPVGPPVVWRRAYNSLRGPLDTAYQNNDFGVGWTQTYNVGVYSVPIGGAGPQKPTGPSWYLILQNGAQMLITTPGSPGPSNPKVACTVPAGVPLLVEWDYDSGTGGDYFRITLPDRSQWITNDRYDVGSTLIWYGLGKVADQVGNTIQIHYSTPPPNRFPLITSISNGAGATLLTVTRGSNGNITQVADCYNRSVYYAEGAFLTFNVPPGYPQSYQELTSVSQIGSASARWSYGYTAILNTNGLEEVPFLTSITVPSPTGSGNSTSTINYNQSDFVAGIVDGNNNKHTYTATDSNHTRVAITNSAGAGVYGYTAGFDSNMSVTSQTDGTNSTVVWSGVYSDPNDPFRPSSVTDGDNLTTSMTWDKYGNIQTLVTPQGTKTAWTWAYTNFALGELAKYQEGSNRGASAKQPTTVAYYEPSGLVQSVTYPLPGTAGGTQNVTASFQYSALGDLTQVTAPGNNAASSIVTTLNYTTDGSYNQAEALGEPIAISNNLSKVTHLRYDARENNVTYQDPLLNETDSTYNLADQPLQVTYPPTGQTGSGRAYDLSAYLYPGGPLTSVTSDDESGAQVRQVSYGYGQEGEFVSRAGSAEPFTAGYDGAYRLLTLADGNSHVTQWQYNTAGYPSQMGYPGGDSVQITSYDNAGKPLVRLDGRGVETDYTWAGADGLLSKIHYPASSGIDVSLTWDAYDRASTMADGTGGQGWSYDDLDALTSDATTYAGLSAQTVSYGFYPDGSRQSMTTPAGVFRYYFDGGQRLTQVANPYTETFNWSWLDNDWLFTQQLVNGSGTTLANSAATYDAWGEATEWVNKNGNSSATLSDFGGTGSNVMGYDGAGNLKSMLASVPGATQYGGLTSYTLDNKNQLTQEQSARNGGYTENNGFDGAGNATTLRGLSALFNSDNQNTAQTWDGAGNPTTYNGAALTFDAESRMTAYGAALTAGYRGDDLRAWKQTASGRTYFLYDGIQPVCELNSSGAVIASNTFGAAGLVSRNVSGTSTFYTFDPQGGVSQRLDSNGNVLANYMFDAFGARAGTDASTDPFTGFGGGHGYYMDWETGLQSMAFRYYDSAAGRFLNRDPIGYDGGINVYRYVGNDPSVWTDASGLDGQRGKQRSGGNDPRFRWTCPQILAEIARLKKAGQTTAAKALEHIAKLMGCKGSGIKKGQPHKKWDPSPVFVGGRGPHPWGITWPGGEPGVGAHVPGGHHSPPHMPRVPVLSLPPLVPVDPVPVPRPVPGLQLPEPVPIFD